VYNHIKYQEVDFNVAYYLVFIVQALINQINKCTVSTQTKSLIVYRLLAIFPRYRVFVGLIY
jgi:hypothetical protein